VSYRFEKLVERHGMPRITLHKLRHLAASLQVAAGVDIGIVSKRLRHSSVKITNDTYSHMIGTIGRQAAEAAAAIFPAQHVWSLWPLTRTPGRRCPASGARPTKWPYGLYALPGRPRSLAY
jgi:hypothetical protein